MHLDMFKLRLLTLLVLMPTVVGSHEVNPMEAIEIKRYSNGSLVLRIANTFSGYHILCIARDKNGEILGTSLTPSRNIMTKVVMFDSDKKMTSFKCIMDE